MELSIESRCQHVTWKVKDFFQLPSESLYFLDSPKFSFADDKYCLRLYPSYWDELSEERKIGIWLERLTYNFPERNVSLKLGFSLIDVVDDIHAYFSLSSLHRSLWWSRSLLMKKRDEYVPGGNFTVFCSLRLGEESSGVSPQSEEAKTSDTKEEQDGLPGQSAFYSSRWRSSKMELSTESPYQHVTWKIPDTDQLFSKNVDSVNSPEFRFAGDRYCLRFYKKVDKNGGTDDTGLQLVRLTSTFPENIVWHKVGFRTGTKVSRDDKYFYTDTFCDDLGLRLSRGEQDEYNDLLFPDGTLTVICSMRLGDQSSTSRKSEERGTSDGEEKQGGLPGVVKLQSDYRQLLQKGVESDACFVVSGKEFRAHRCVLRVRSPVFEAMFRHKTVEKESGRVVIDDLDPESFGKFLEYLYTGTVRLGLSEDNAFGLYAAADKYDVPTLKSECVAHMRRTLSVDSFCDVITLALRHHEQDLLQQAIAFFRENLQHILVTVKWQQFVIDNGTSANELLIKAFVSRGQ